MDENKLWYAVMISREDDDWGSGTYDYEEAVERVLAARVDGCPDAYIAVIEEGPDPICVEEITEF